MNGQQKEKVIIIGAGPAGITAGYELLKQAPDRYDVIILEESNEIGGISKTIKYHGNRMDLGGHRFFSKNDDVMAWWDHIMPKQGDMSYDDKILGRKKELNHGGPDPETEDEVMLIRDRVSRIYYQKKFFDYPVSLKWKTIKNMGFLTTIRAGTSYLYACTHKLKETSLENFYINRFGKVLYSMFFEGYTQKLWGRHPREISADWGAQRVKGLSIRAILKDMLSKVADHTLEMLHLNQNNDKNKKNTETSLIEEFYYPKYGPGQMWELAARKFTNMGGTLITNAKVVKINKRGKTYNDNEIHVITGIEYIQNGVMKKMDGDIIISSMPLKDLIKGMNDVPENVQRIAGGLPYRDFVTVGVLVKKLNLKNETKIKTLNNIVPDCWIYVQDTKVRLGRIQIFNNWSPYLVKNVEEHVWIGMEYFCDEKDKFYRLSEKQCIRYATKELIKMGIISSQEDVLDAHREKVKKAYPAYFDTYQEIDTLVKYLNTIDNLYCVGRNGQHRYNNMDHSMITSFETVKNIIHNQSDRSNIWNVNVEGEYHESR
ncbi:MAG: NAD(P)/FAD-dependent oxidoreductase [Lachnospiraceae bacterium]|nr:NAD(P)/FAD-dependent oxidoreductase [Lachnospiraceae bacterium]